MSNDFFQQQVEKYDPSDVLGSVGMIPQQIEQVWKQGKKFTLPKGFSQATSVCVFGMGGSALGSDFLASVFRDELKAPITIVNDYIVPAWVNRSTLVILSSYSGTTEEVLHAAEQVFKKTKLIVAVSSGGALGQWAQKKRIPSLIFDPIHNPCKQPRVGIGYGIASQLVVLKAARLVSVSDMQIKQLIVYLNKLVGQYNNERVQSKNEAKKLATLLQNKVPVFMTAEHMKGAGHIFQNQFHETAKQFAVNFPLPELNHHLLEGLSFPQNVLKNMIAVCCESTLYHARNQKRFRVTQTVLKKQGILSYILHVQGSTQCEQALGLVLLASYATLYLAMLNKVNPAEIPWVDFFKKQLK
ncbi:MAG TPA: SIS domain-containing protein [Patescibacteria group bacterium]|nr:SIS domain-containing protein [Patescibacteria group bacterium]